MGACTLLSVKSDWEEKMAAALASVFVIASLAHAKPQVGFGFPSSSSTSLEQRVPNTCTSLSARVDSGAHVHHHLWSSSWPVVCLPLPTPWHRLHSLYFCWRGSTLVLHVDHKCWHPY